MKKVLNGEKVERSTTVSDNVVTCQHVTKHDKLGNVSIAWSFDFNDVPYDELLRLAARSLLIDSRRDFKPLDEKIAKTWDGKVFNVNDMLSATRKKSDPLVSAKKLYDKMTPEQRAEWLAQFQ